MADVAIPETPERTAAVLVAAAAEGRSVRIAGAGTKSRWGLPPGGNDPVLLSTARLDRPVELRRGDASVRVGAGVALARVAEELAAAERRLALDPARLDAATVGGVLATADSGPLAHRYGGPREQLRAATVALGDGTVARVGAEVPRSVAGVDLVRLLCGSYGTLGVIVEVSLAVVPLHERTLTVLGLAPAPRPLAAAVGAMAGAGLELEALDLAWRGGRGGLLARTAGPHAARQAGRAARVMRAAGLRGVEVTPADTALWERQRAGQRSTGRCLLRIGTRLSRLESVLELGDRHGATVVGRAATGRLYLELDPEALVPVRAGLAPGDVSTLLDVPAWARDGLGPADVQAPLRPELVSLNRAVKRALDPHGTCNPGLGYGGI